MKLAGAHVAAPVPAVASTSGTTNNSSEASTLVEATRATQTGALPRWIDKDIKRVGPFKSFLHGRNQRTPGHYGDQTFEEVHITVRLRGFGRNKDDSSIVPRYQVVADGRKWVWRSLPPGEPKPDVG
jgi:hypothetical protein